ncbi:MAG: S-methyl-5'-thioinosine phosphorylase [Nostocoides sp.]
MTGPGDDSVTTSATPPPLGIIAGTGFYALDALTEVQEQSVGTAYGTARLTRGRWHGLPVAFMTRHGAGHSVPPHLVNYRANISALRDVGCADVIAVNVVGGIDPTLQPGALVLLDDFLDFTQSRPTTLHDGSGAEGVVHVDVTEAYHPALRRELLRAAEDSSVVLRDGGVYACFEGPRFESPAEIRMAGLLGGHVAGMTGIPEATLAVEAGLRYAAVSLVVNPAAGLSTEKITMHDVGRVLTESSARVITLLDAVVRARVGRIG